MKINVNLTVTVDRESWQAAYGEMTPAEMRADVKRWVATAVQAQLQSGVDDDAEAVAR